jgi:hypothetical protein
MNQKSEQDIIANRFDVVVSGRGVQEFGMH